jgi:hypothetical protein
MEVCKIMLGMGADPRIKNSGGRTAAELISAVKSDKGKELYEYLKKTEEERAELEMAFKRAHVEKKDDDDDNNDDVEEEDEEEEKEDVLR